MKRLRELSPLLLALACALTVGILLLTGRIDLDTIPDAVQDNHAAALVILSALFLLKGFSGVILYDALIIAVSLVFPLWEALLINILGTAVTLSVSYMLGRMTKTRKLDGYLDRNPKIAKHFRTAKAYGFVFCFAVHTLGLNTELLGILFGLLRTGYVRYLTSSLLGILPGTILFTVVGNTLDFRSPLFITVAVIDALFILFGFLYTGYKSRHDETRK